MISEVQSRQGKHGLEFYYFGPIIGHPQNRPIEYIFDGENAEARALASAMKLRVALRAA